MITWQCTEQFFLMRDISTLPTTNAKSSFSDINAKSSTNVIHNNRLCKKLPRRELEHYLPPSQCYLLVAPLPNFWNCNDGGSPKPAIRGTYSNFNQHSSLQDNEFPNQTTRQISFSRIKCSQNDLASQTWQIISGHCCGDACHCCTSSQETQRKKYKITHLMHIIPVG